MGLLIIQKESLTAEQEMTNIEGFKTIIASLFRIPCSLSDILFFQSPYL